MKHLFTKTLLFLAVIATSSVHAATFDLSPSLGMYRIDSNKNASDLELRLGYTFDSGLYVGGLYTLTSEGFIQDSNSYYVAPTVGYKYKGAYVLGSYIFAGDQDLNSGGIKYARANGVQLTLGFALPIYDDILLGPEITYRQVKFKDEEVQGVASGSSRRDIQFIPSIAVWFQF